LIRQFVGHFDCPFVVISREDDEKSRQLSSKEIGIK